MTNPTFCAETNKQKQKHKNESNVFFMFSPFLKCYTCCGGISLFVFECRSTKND